MKRFVFLIALIVLVAAGWGGVWLFVSNKISEQVQLLAADDPSKPSIKCTNFSVSGFPFQFAVDCQGATLVDGDTTLTLEQLRAVVLVYRPTHALLFFKGPLHHSNAFFGTEQEVRWSKLEASVRLSGWQLTRASIHGEDVEYFDVLIGETLQSHAQSFEAHLIDIPESHDSENARSALALFARTSALSVPALTINDGEASLEAELTQLPSDIRNWAQPDLIKNWQIAGGDLKLQRFEGSTPSAQFDMAGSLALDKNGALNGKMTLNSNGIAQMFAELITPSMQPLIFGTPGPDGQYTQTISFLGGAVFSGTQPMAYVPPLF